MASHPLRVALEKKFSGRHVDRLISKKVSGEYFTRQQALLAVARDAGISAWTKYASEEDLAVFRANTGGRAAAAPPAAVPATPRATGARATPARTAAPRAAAPRRSGERVFVVHGRNGTISDSMFAFLRAVGLDPIEWGVAMHQTGKGTPNILETIDAGLAGVAAVVVVLTPDDDVILKERFHTDDDPDDEKKLSGQARPNVLFEGGLAFGRHPEKTIFVRVGKVKSFTDLGGFHITRLNNTAPKRSELVGKLRTAGADAKTDGRTQWYTAGDFDIKEDDDGDE
jgi:predicted nucleotide-binding protein